MTLDPGHLRSISNGTTQASGYRTGASPPSFTFLQSATFGPPCLTSSLIEIGVPHGDSRPCLFLDETPCLFYGFNTRRTQYGVKPDLWLFNGHLQDHKQLPIVVCPEIALQVCFVTPLLLEHENIIFLLVPVNAAAKTARLNTALLSYRPEDSQCFANLFGRERHPYACENHVLISLLVPAQGSSQTF